MNTIKLRAWDKYNKKMIFDQKEIFERLADNDGTFDYMLSTGIKDKTGKEIFEGDIIRHPVHNKPHSNNRKKDYAISEVIWYNGCNVQENEHNNKILATDPSAFNREPGFSIKEIINKKEYNYMDWSGFAGCEIIGNIYANPEILWKK